MKNKLLIGLVGNPNSGKTTIFNSLTGSMQKVGNYPGVTVEKTDSIISFKDITLNLVDLPGTYSLNAFSEDEMVTRNFILNEKPDLILNILDSSNIERNLFLTVQIMELNIPLILIFNMNDAAKSKGIEFNQKLLEHYLDSKIIFTVGHKDNPGTKIFEAIYELNNKNMLVPKYYNIDYGADIEAWITKITSIIDINNQMYKDIPKRWIALKLLENDKHIKDGFSSSKILENLKLFNSEIQKIYGDIPEIIFADKRYGFISGACHESVKNTVEWRHSISDKIDEFVTSQFLGLPIFLFLMYLVFSLTFTLAEYPMHLIEKFFQFLSINIVGAMFPGDSIIKSLLSDGIISGVGGVIVFIPNIFLLFFAIAILEDSGYMARAAYVLDKLMHKIGLHGKSFIPMLIGFGCTVPAIMASKILDSKRDKLLTILILPLMSCGARFTIYAMIIPAFFDVNLQGPILWGVYVFGIILAVLFIKMFGSTILKGHQTELIMELPPYRMPTFRGLFIHIWQRCFLYLKKAGTTILLISIILWVLTSFPRHNTLTPETPLNKTQILENSYAAKIGKFIEPVIQPIGFDWRIGTALLGAVAAKEVFISQMAIIFSCDDRDETTLRTSLKKAYSNLTAICILIFCLVSFPCAATLVATRKETGRIKWAVFQFVYLTFSAYIICLIIYQTGKCLM